MLVIGHPGIPLFAFHVLIMLAFDLSELLESS